MKINLFQTAPNLALSVRSSGRASSVLGALIFAASALAAPGCGSQVTDTGTETHWLKACRSDAECGGRLSCLCNVCTRECSEANACPGQAPYCVGGEALGCAADRELAVCYVQSENELIATSSEEDAGTGLDPIDPKVPALDERRPDPDTCDSLGWCWESPVAPGERFTAFSPDRQFVVGERGTVFSITDGYLPPPTTSDLLAVVTRDGQPWVASSAGIWSHSGRVWARRSEVGASALAVTPSGEVWALRGDGVLRLEGESWVNLTPTSTRKEMLFFEDLAANDDGSVSVLGSYFLDKSTSEGVMFTWSGKSWQERAAGFTTGSVRFFEGPASPYVYHVPSNGDDTTARVYEPARDWRLVAERDSGATGTVFWGPDGHWWLGSYGAVLSFDDEASKVASGVTCGSAINWDRTTVLCAGETGGLSFITASEDGVIDASPSVPTFAPYAPETFVSQPTPVWAQADEAWGASETDVWRAPLEQYNGRVWRNRLSEGDTFSARSIEGTASDDVWFASETELRHWDGRAVTSVALPDTVPQRRILSLRAAASAEVTVLLETTTQPFQVLILSNSVDGWVTEYQVETNLTHAYGTIAGAGDQKWATLGHEVLRQQKGAWAVFTELDANDGIIHSVSDDDTLWLLTDVNVYHLDGTVPTLVGYRPTVLQRLALTPEYVWNFSGGHVRKLPR